MPWLTLLCFFASVPALEIYRYRARQPLVRDWLEANGWQLRSVRYSFSPSGWNWLAYFAVEVADAQGRELRGVVYAGASRRKVGWHRPPATA